MRLTVTKLSTRSVRCGYRLTAEPDGRLAFDGEVVVVCVDTNTFKPKALPDRVRAAFERHVEANEG